MPDQPLLEVKAVSKVYGGGFFKKREAVVALDGLSFSLVDDRPTITAIAGESGSGKTTLAHLLLGHITPTSGQVPYRGRDVASMGSRERLQLAPRCPSVMDGCWLHRPAFYRADEHRVAACFLYQDRPVLETADVADVFPADTIPQIPTTGGTP
jgi:peptide/nickel transport system ATP-binding protein